MQLNHLGSDTLLAASKYIEWEESFRERRARGEFVGGDDQDDDFDVQGYIGSQSTPTEHKESPLSIPPVPPSPPSPSPSQRSQEGSSKTPFGDPRANFLRSQSMWDGELSQGANIPGLLSTLKSSKPSAHDGSRHGSVVGKEKRMSGLSRARFAHVTTQMSVERKRHLLEELFTLGPKGPGSVHNVARIVASRPHLCMLVDKAVSLQPGSELFTLSVGPRESSWKPFYKEGTQATAAVADDDGESHKIRRIADLFHS